MTDFPVTPAIRQLRAANAAFELHAYTYVEHGGTRAACDALNIPEHACVKTLVMELPDKKPFVILMRGDREVSLKQLARVLNVKSVAPCDPATADRHSGYQVGGTSPFGLRKPMPVYVERDLLDLPDIWINAGRRGLLFKITPSLLTQLLNAKPVEVAV